MERFAERFSTLNGLAQHVSLKPSSINGSNNITKSGLIRRYECTLLYLKQSQKTAKSAVHNKGG